MMVDDLDTSIRFRFQLDLHNLAHIACIGTTHCNRGEGFNPSSDGDVDDSSRWDTGPGTGW